MLEGGWSGSERVGWWEEQFHETERETNGSSVSGSGREADGWQGSSVRGGKSSSVREADGGH